MKNIKFLKSLVCILIIFTTFLMLVYWAYKGYFPFNTNIGKDIHYWVFDNYHIAFNISNFEYDNFSYYCKQSHKNELTAIVNKQIYYQKDLDEIQSAIYKLKQSKYIISDYDISKIQLLYDQAHIFNDNYYVRKAENELILIKSKKEHNAKCDALINKLEDEAKYINEVLIPANTQKILNYCVKTL